MKARSVQDIILVDLERNQIFLLASGQWQYFEKMAIFGQFFNLQMAIYWRVSSTLELTTSVTSTSFNKHDK